MRDQARTAHVTERVRRPARAARIAAVLLVDGRADLGHGRAPDQADLACQRTLAAPETFGHAAIRAAIRTCRQALTHDRAA